MSTTETPVAKDIALDTTPETTSTAAHESLEQLHLPDVPPPPAVITLTPLRTLREGQERSIEDIASALRLSQAQINSLEDSRWDSLPGAAYVKGFLRNYARTLGVDPQPYIDAYSAQMQPQIATPASHAAPVAAPIKRAVIRSTEVLKNDPPPLQSFRRMGEAPDENKGIATMVGLLIAATLAFLMYWERGLWLPKVEPLFKSISTWLGSTGSVTTRTTAPLPPTAPAVLQTPAMTVDTSLATPSPDIKPVESTPSAAARPATGPIRALTLQLSKAAWIEVRDSGNNVLYFGTKPAGAQTLKGNAPLSIVIGAADAVALKVDGQAFDVQSKALGNVARFSIQ